MLTVHVQTLTTQVAELEAKLGVPPKTPDNSSLPPSQGRKPNQQDKPKRKGPRQGSLGRKGGGRALVEYPDEIVIARPACCARCQAALHENTQMLAVHYDKIELPTVKPVVTRGWSATPDIAKAVAAPRWRRCRRGWSRASRSVSTSWRWRSICASPTRSATAVSAAC